MFPKLFILDILVWIIIGKFSRPSYEDGIDYAFAAPSGESLFGATYICPDCFKDSSVEGVFADTIKLSGYQIGERFGHSLCAVDINGDNYDDLVVGAPLHSEGKSVIIHQIIFLKTTFNNIVYESPLTNFIFHL